MAAMGFGVTGDETGEVRFGHPLGETAPDHAGQVRSVWIPGLEPALVLRARPGALSGDHQDLTQTVVLGAPQKGQQVPARFGAGQPVKIQTRLYLEPSAAQAAVIRPVGGSSDVRRRVTLGRTGL